MRVCIIDLPQISRRFLGTGNDGGLSTHGTGPTLLVPPEGTTKVEHMPTVEGLHEVADLVPLVADGAVLLAELGLGVPDEGLTAVDLVLGRGQRLDGGHLGAAAEGKGREGTADEVP